MLSVVHGQFAAPEGEGETAEPGPAFEQGDAHARVGERERGGHTGEAAPDDDGGTA